MYKFLQKNKTANRLLAYVIEVASVRQCRSLKRILCRVNEQSGAEINTAMAAQMVKQEPAKLAKKIQSY